MTAARSDRRPVVRLYAKRPKDRRWQLVGEYATRSAAWDAIAAVPKGYAVWLNDVRRPNEAGRTAITAEEQAAKAKS